MNAQVKVQAVLEQELAHLLLGLLRGAGPEGAHVRAVGKDAQCRLPQQPIPVELNRLGQPVALSVLLSDPVFPDVQHLE